MSLGSDPLGSAPFGSLGVTEAAEDTLITPDVAELTLSAGTSVVATGIPATSAALVFTAGDATVASITVEIFDPEGVSQGTLVFRSGTARIGSVLTLTGAAFALSGGAVSIGTALQPDGAAITVSGGTVSLGVAIAVTGAAVALSGGEPAVGAGVAPVAAEIMLAGGDPVFGSQVGITAASIVLTGGAPHVGSGMTLTAGEFAFAGGTPSLATALKPGFATLWFSGGVMPETAEAPQGTVVVLNANTLAASEYSIAALDVIEHEGELYFVQADGLSKLVDSGTVDADTDFTAAVQTGALYLAGNKIGVVPRAYVGAKTSAALQLTVSTYSYGATLANEYTAPVPVASTCRAQVVPLGKGAEAEAWQFKIDSVAPGARWDLASLEAVVSPIKRPRS